MPNFDDSHQDRISGPLLDRIDIQVEVPAMPPSSLSAQADGEPSAVIALRVLRAFELQLARQGQSNEGLSTREVDQHCRLDATGEDILRNAMLRLHWSARAYHRVLKVARTVADLAGEAQVGAAHVAEAIQFRRGLREL